MKFSSFFSHTPDTAARGEARRGALPVRAAVFGICILVLAVFLFRADFSAVQASASGFSFLKGLFVTEAKGYGMYTEAGTSRFEKGSKIHIYLEVDGFQNLKKDDGFTINIGLDLQVKDDKGNVGIEQKDVVNSELFVKSPWRDFFFTVNIDLAELPPGKYTLCFIATDKTSDKKASHEMDMEIF